MKRTGSIPLSVLILAATSWISPGVCAATLTVDNTNGGGPGSFRQAIQDAADGDGAYESQTPGPFWTPTRAPAANWAALASSADGRTLVAAVKGGPIYVSSDSGGTWNLTSAPNTNWSAVASSADGTRFVAAVAVFEGSQYQSGGPIYVSADAGATWVQTSAPITNWSAVSCSADGNKLVAVSGGYVVYMTSAPSGPIYRSSDFGATWLPTSVSEANCTSLASSADGSKLVAASYQSPLYFSIDSGATWHDVMPTFPYLVSVASSADGTRLLAGTWDPFHPPGTGGHFNIVLSTNSGATWNYSEGGDRGRAYVASSADGTTLVAAGGPNGFGLPGPILISTNGGETWTANNSPTDKWRAVVCSADGSKITAAVEGGGIWTFQSAPTPKLRIVSAGSELVLSWIVPSTDFVLQQSPDLTATNWTDATESPTLSFTSLRHEVALPLPAGPRFYRLRH